MLSPESQQQNKLLKILGVTFGIAVIIGGTIGTGILRTPGIVAAKLHSPWLIMGAWVVGGIYALLGTISVAELGTMLPKAGGWYVYARRSLGEYAGFVVGWSDWLGNSAAIAFAAVTLCQYMALLYPSLSGDIKIFASIIIILFFLIHMSGLRLASRAQELTSFAKAAAFIILIAACFIFGNRSNAVTISHPNVINSLLSQGFFVAVVFALQSVIYTYDGWYGEIYFAEEDKNPSKNIPRSMFGAVGIIIAIYILTNLAFLYVLPLNKLASSKLPAADAVMYIFGKDAGYFITILAIVSLLGIINSVLMLTPRILYAMSRDNLFHHAGTKVNDGGTPTTALLLSSAAALFFVFSGTFNFLLSIATFLWVINYSCGFASIFILRKKEPDLPRPYKVWGYPYTTAIMLVGSLAFLIGDAISDAKTGAYALCLLALTFPVYYIIRKRNNRKTAQII